MGNKGQGERAFSGILQSFTDKSMEMGCGPHFIFLHQLSQVQDMKYFPLCKITLLFNISDRCPIGPSGVAICPFLQLCKCVHPIFLVRERLRDERCPS